MSTYFNRLQPGSPKPVIPCCSFLPPEIDARRIYQRTFSVDGRKSHGALLLFKLMTDEKEWHTVM